MTHEQQLKEYSKLLALVLRHAPETWGIEIDLHGGWTDVDKLLRAANAHGVPLTREMLDEIIATNNKHRYDYDETGTRIRANQGHSIPVDMGFTPVTPPDVLYHGTTGAFLGSIFEKGLLPMSRQFVHLSVDVGTAKHVGGRHGKPVVLLVDCKAMAEKGYKFYFSNNHVWLTDRVPPEFLQVIS